MMTNKWLKLNIQFFAEEGGSAGATGAEGDTTQTTETTQQTDTSKDTPPAKVELTQTELQKKIEAESDRKLSKALEKKQAEWEAKQQEAIDAALAEKERLSKLSEKERKDEELSTREKKLQERTAEIERKELKADAVADLSDKGLPAAFANFLLADNAENTLKNINNFKEAFDAAVNDAVKEKLRQDPPQTGDQRKRTELNQSKAEMARKARIIK